MGSIHLDPLAPYGKADVCKLPQYLLTVILQQNCTACECMLLTWDVVSESPNFRGQF